MSSLSGSLVQRDHVADAYPLLWVLAALCVGICVDRLATIDVTIWCLLITISLLAWTVLHRAGRSRLAAVAVLGSVAGLGGLWHHDRWSLYPADEIARFAERTARPVCVEVTALDASRRIPPGAWDPMCTMTRGATTRVKVRVSAIRQGTRWRAASGAATLIVDGRIPGICRGDRLQVGALIVRVRPRLNPGEPDFAAMRRRNRQLAVLHCDQAASVRRLASGSNWDPLRHIGRTRLWAEDILDRYVGSQRAGLAAALLLGSRDRLDHQTTRMFFHCGTLHLLAISGLHIGILASALWLLIRLDFFPRNALLLTTCTVAILYALMTGARPPVVRATILIVVYCLSRWIGRRAFAWNSLSAAALITLAISPGGTFDPGTQLSFLAVGVLIARWPTARDRVGRSQRDPLDRLVAQSRPVWLAAIYRSGNWLWHAVLVTALIWGVSLPLVANRFHLMTPIGLPANLLLWAPVSVALFTGLAVLLAAPVPLLATLLGWICERSLTLIAWLTSVAAEAPGGHVWVVGPPSWWVLVFYFGLACRQFVRLPIARRWWFGLLAAWIVVGVACGSGSARAWRAIRGQPLHVSFVAVGHGTCVLVELPDGKTLLYDAGRMGNPRSAAMPISSVLWARRLTHLDAIVISHADSDHFNAVPELLERFSVGVIYVSPIMFQNSTPALAALRKAIDSAGVPVGTLREGDRLAAAAGVRLEVLHPPPRGCGSGDNGDSIVISISHRGHRILLTGDLESAGLDELLAELPLRCDILMAPHHGSPHSQPGSIARWATPRFIVVSAGSNCPIERLPGEFAVSRRRFLWTHRDGLVRVAVDDGGLVVRAWVKDPW